MKTKQLQSGVFTPKLYAALFASGLLFTSFSVFAQVKIGSNPTTITTDANLDVEGASSRHMVVRKSGYVGIGTTNPLTTLNVRAFTDINKISASNIVAQFDPSGGADIDAPASIVLNGGRAAFGYGWDTQFGKYAFIRGNESTDIRLQVVSTNGVLQPNAFVMKALGGATGYIGINNEDPQVRLDVRGSVKILPSGGLQNGNLGNGTSNKSGFEVVTGSDGDAYVGIQRAGSSASLFISKPAGAADADRFLQFSVGGASVGSVAYNGSGITVAYTSDQRLKENIHATQFGLEALKTVKVYDYNFKADSKKTLSTGVLAQELSKVYPQAVSVGGTDAKTNPWQVDYIRLVPMLIKSVQELSQEVESLKSEKAQLSTELNGRVSQLEGMLNVGVKPGKSVSQ